jgi:hypothetical protein
MKKHVVIATLLCLSTLSAPAMAAKFERSSTPPKGVLSLPHQALVNACDLSEINLDCNVITYKITEKKSSEAWTRTVQQLIYATGAPYVEDVSASAVPKNGRAITKALEEVLEATGFYDKVEDTEANAFWDEFGETLQNQILDESSVIAVEGGIDGAFSLSHAYLALIDRKSGEVVIISGGYSE